MVAKSGDRSRNRETYRTSPRKRGVKGRVGNEGGITTSARTSFELVGADRGLAGLCERRTAGAWPVDCRGVKSARFRAEEGGGREVRRLKFRKISRNWEGNSCDRSASINAGIQFKV